MTSAIDSLGQALLHFLWQGALIAALFMVVRRAWGRLEPRIEYGLACGTLFLMLLAPAVTFLALSGYAQPAAVPNSAPSASVAIPSVPLRHLPATADFRFTPVIVALWAAGVLLFSFRWLGAWLYVARLRRSAVASIPMEWRRSLDVLLCQFAIHRKVQFLLYAGSIPSVAGWLKPVILFPAAAVTRLSMEQVEALLAHELAHVLRDDYLWNLLQTGIETLLFYHPAVWWISRQIREAREQCCDDMAAAAVGDRLVYARSLLDCEQLRSAPPQLVMAVNGGSLRARIDRLLCGSAPRDPAPAWWLVPMMVVLALVALSGHPHATPRPSEPRLNARVPLTETRRAFRLVRTVFASQIAAVKPLRAIAFAAQAGAPKPASDQNDFLRGMMAAGLPRLTVDDLIQLKIHGVTPETARAAKAAFPQITTEQLVLLSIHGVDPNYIAAMKSAWPAATIQDLIELRIHGVDPGYIAAMTAATHAHLSLQDVVQMRIHGLPASLPAELRAAGYGDLSAQELIGLHIRGVDHQFVEHLRTLGFPKLTVDQLIRLRTSGI